MLSKTESVVLLSIVLHVNAMRPAGSFCQASKKVLFMFVPTAVNSVVSAGEYRDKRGRAHSTESQQP